MASETTTAITAVKQDVRLREWAEQLEAQQASGLTVPQRLRANLLARPMSERRAFIDTASCIWQMMHRFWRFSLFGDYMKNLAWYVWFLCYDTARICRSNSVGKRWISLKLRTASCSPLSVSLRIWIVPSGGLLFFFVNLDSGKMWSGTDLITIWCCKRMTCAQKCTWSEIWVDKRTNVWYNMKEHSFFTADGYLHLTETHICGFIERDAPNAKLLWVHWFDLRAWNGLWTCRKSPVIITKPLQTLSLEYWKMCRLWLQIGKKLIKQGVLGGYIIER